MFLTGLLIVSSSKKTEEEVSTQPTTVGTNNVNLSIPISRVENGMLVFKNGIDYYKGAEILNTASITSLNNWNKSVGFRSQKQIFNEVVAAEYAIFNPALEKAGKPRPTEHSTAYTTALSSGVLKIQPQEGWAEHYTFAIHPFYAARYYVKKQEKREKNVFFLKNYYLCAC